MRYVCLILAIAISFAAQYSYRKTDREYTDLLDPLYEKLELERLYLSKGEGGIYEEQIFLSLLLSKLHRVYGEQLNRLVEEVSMGMDEFFRQSLVQVDLQFSREDEKVDEGFLMSKNNLSLQIRKDIRDQSIKEKSITTKIGDNIPVVVDGFKGVPGSLQQEISEESAGALVDKAFDQLMLKYNGQLFRELEDAKKNRNHLSGLSAVDYAMSRKILSQRARAARQRAETLPYFDFLFDRMKSEMEVSRHYYLACSGMIDGRLEKSLDESAKILLEQEKRGKRLFMEIDLMEKAMFRKKSFIISIYGSLAIIFVILSVFLFIRKSNL